MSDVVDFARLKTRLNPLAQQALKTSTEISRKYSQYFLGVEHIFAGLLRTTPGLFRKMIPHPVIAQLKDELRTNMERGVHRPEGTKIKVTPRADCVLRITLDEAQRDNCQQARPDHLLRAILQEGKSLPVRLLESKELRPSELLQALRAAHGRAAQEFQSLPPALRNVLVDLTSAAEAGGLSPVVGRRTELKRLYEALLVRDGPSSALLTGHAGVGKTAVVEGFAQQLADASEELPRRLRSCRIYSLSVDSLGSGVMLRAMLGQRLSQILQYFAKHKDEAILFIDEIHSLLVPGLVGTFLPPLARGDVRIIGTTTSSQYNHVIRPNDALVRRFTRIEIEEPSLDVVQQVLHAMKELHEAQHDIHIADAAIAKTLELAPRYVRWLKLPHKAKQWLELALPKAELDDRNEVTAEDVIEVVSEQANVPAEFLDGSSDRLNRLRRILSRRVVGQEHVLSSLQEWMLSELGPIPKRNPRAPNGVFLFLGPTGVGKTETAKALAEFLFGDETRMIRLDMAEYHDNHSYNRLIGFGRGIVGAEQGGLLTEKVKRTPNTILLLDEIEKAHPTTLQLFLSIFDEGWVTSGLGETVFFSDTTIIMTSNLGSELFAQEEECSSLEDVPVSEADVVWEMPRRAGRRVEVVEHIESQALIAPELLNRVTSVLVFDPLTRSDAANITRLLIERLQVRIAPFGKELTVDEDALQLIAERGYSAMYNARELERTFRQLVENKLNAMFEAGLRFRVHSRDGDVVMDVETGQLPPGGDGNE